MNIKSKLPNTPVSIFAKMSGLANEVGAINLSQGFPGFPCAPELIELVSQAMKDGHNQYAPMPGLLELREVIADKMKTLYGAEYCPKDEVTLTAGATQGIYTVLSALVAPGDEVIIFEPCYDSYIPGIKINGGIPVHIKLSAPDYNIDWSVVKDKITAKTKLIIINSPQNPTGAVLSKNDLLALENIVVENNLLLLSDEVYEHLIYDGVEHESVAKYEALRNRTVICYSFGKVFHVTGWKLGYCLAPKYLTDEIRKVHQFIVFSCNMPMQKAMARYLQNEETYLSLPSFFEKKRAALIRSMRTSRFKINPTRGTYFQLIDYSEISDEKDTDMANRLTREYGVASIPISAFYHDRYDQKMLRLCFAKDESELIEAGKRLSKV